MEKITIIVPVYNVEKYLYKCLTSIVNQTYTELEVLCINDGSTDCSLQICEEFAEKDCRIRIISQENRGLAAVRNRGIKEASCDYIAFVDSDDYIDEDFIEKLYKCLKENHSDISVANVLTTNQDEKTLLLTETDGIQTFLTREEAMKEFLNPEGGLGNYIWNKLYKKEAFDGIEFPENKLFEDAYTMFRILDNVNTVSVVKDTCYQYYMRMGSITSNYATNFKNYDLLNANKEKAYFICEKYPNLTDLAFHQYYIAFMWLTNRSIINQIDNNDVLLSYFRDLKYLKKKYHVKLYDIKEKAFFNMVNWNIKVYRWMYRILRGDRRSDKL